MLDLDYQHSAELANLIMRSINVKICTKDLACQTVLEGKFGFNQSYIGIPSTLNNDYLLWHTQLIVCAEKYKIMV